MLFRWETWITSAEVNGDIESVVLCREPVSRRSLLHYAYAVDDAARAAFRQRRQIGLLQPSGDMIFHSVEYVPRDYITEVSAPRYRRYASTVPYAFFLPRHAAGQRWNQRLRADAPTAAMPPFFIDT